MPSIDTLSARRSFGGGWAEEKLVDDSEVVEMEVDASWLFNVSVSRFDVRSYTFCWLDDVEDGC